ncbi:thioredoxin domain-containing protein [Vibrio sp. SCSIO 43136]|uniref:thioredoxin domain-containing protein n=1 Tax=Vibrio sp. SCSIO 43136 TaxID=2819101 RepID=UPI0020759388|nr:thioredoxin domain-containing protein [Vibrio sp. SCSIO 43136]USD67173.1 thioredoxin domain-containing protein [Vibrio sp. SCSIO 43136]
MIQSIKPLVSATLASLFLAVSPMALAMDIEEGMDYQVIDSQVSEDQDVRVYFSFRCGHCATLDSTYAEVSQQLPEGVCLKKVPVFNPNDKLDLLYAKTLAVAEQNGKALDFTHEMFTALRSGDAPMCMNTMTEFAADKLDIEPLVFQRNFFSTQTKTMVDEYLADSTAMNINAVPVVIVGNKYQVVPKRVTSFDEYKQLVKEVVSKHRTSDV